MYVFFVSLYTCTLIHRSSQLAPSHLLISSLDHLSPSMPRLTPFSLSCFSFSPYVEFRLAQKTSNMQNAIFSSLTFIECIHSYLCISVPIISLLLHEHMTLTGMAIRVLNHLRCQMIWYQEAENTILFWVLVPGN